MIADKITFFLLNKKGYIVLKRFIETYSSKEIHAVVGSTDVGISKDYYNEIKEVCLKNNIRFLERKDFVKVETQYSFAIGWRWMINTDSKLIVVHDSLLPRYRGFAPLVSALVNGDKEIGVTALFACEKYDEGYIILQKSISVVYPKKIHDAIEEISILYSEITNKIFYNIVNKIEIKTYSQNNRDAIYSLWRDEDDYYIDWRLSSEYIKRFIDAVGQPYGGAKSYYNDSNNLIVIEDAMEFEDVTIINRDVGKIIFIDDGKPVVVCGKGLLKINVAFRYDTKESIIPISKFRSRFI